MHFHTITSRFSTDSGQAAIEFALMLPLLIAFLLLIVGFARVFNAYNDLNQMAADGARMAAVGGLPSDPAQFATAANAFVAANADTPATKPPATTISRTYSSGSCQVGGTVTIKASATVSLIPFLPYVAKLSYSPVGESEMRVEQCPSS